MKLIKIAINNCLGCLYSEPTWTKKGEVYLCKNSKDENGYCKYIPDPNLIPDWCTLEDIEEI